MTVTIASQTVLPPDDPGDLESLSEVLPRLSPRLREGVATLVSALSQGEAVRVEPISTILTTGQAADILNISRMTLVKLLDEGKIPCERPNSHRLVRLADVLAYKQERAPLRSAYFRESMEQAEADGLLDLDINDYTSALR